MVLVGDVIPKFWFEELSILLSIESPFDTYYEYNCVILSYFIFYENITGVVDVLELDEVYECVEAEDAVEGESD